MAAAARNITTSPADDPNIQPTTGSSSNRRGITAPQRSTTSQPISHIASAQTQADRLGQLIRDRQTREREGGTQGKTPNKAVPLSSRQPATRNTPSSTQGRPANNRPNSPSRPLQLPRTTNEAPANDNAGNEFQDNFDQNPSVLDASKYTSPAYSSANDTDLDGQDAGERNRRFQEQQRNASGTAAQFLAGSAAEQLGQYRSGDANQRLSDQSMAGSMAGRELQNSAYNTDHDQTRRFSEYLKQRAASLRLAKQQSENAEETNEATQTSVEILETIQRGRRLLTAVTGVGVFLAVAETDLVAINRGFFKGSVRILPGSRPKNQQYRHKSDYVDIGMALLMHIVGIVMLFGLFIEMLPIIIPFVAAIVGTVVLQQMFGDSVASMLSSLIH